MAGAPGSSSDPFGRLSFPVTLALVWAVCSSLCILLSWDRILHFGFTDPDDSMRLLEVRDWIAGQSWFDVTQYRLDPPHGYSMHWSRLLDVPIAAIIVLIRPFFGQHVAEIAACTIIPMITLGCTMALVAAIARRLVSPGLALLSAAFCTIDLGTFYAMRILRIDHHGWQIVAGLGIVLALIGNRSATKAAVAGLCAALWMHISLEGIAFTTFTAAWLGVSWLMAPDREGLRLPAFFTSLTAASLVLFLVAHGGRLFDRTFCDAISPVHMVAFAIGAIGSLIAIRRAQSSLFHRIMLLGSTAIACAAYYRLSAPQCTDGAFNLMTPLVRQVWYLHVQEGRPLWERPLGECLAWITYPCVGLAGAILLVLRTPCKQKRADALALGMLLVGATAIGFVVMRASAFANILAIPGVAVLAGIGLEKLDKIGLTLPRAAAKTLLLLLLTPVTPAFATLSDPPADKRAASQAPAVQCDGQENVAKLDAIASTTIMTPMDIAPALLVGSHHSAVGSGYHRNGQAMDDILRFFTTTSDAEAKAIVKAHHTTLLAYCPGGRESFVLRGYAPHGLAARLAADRPPAWLRPVNVPGLQIMKVYTILD